jgi:hypothetical protein
MRRGVDEGGGQEGILQGDERLILGDGFAERSGVLGVGIVSVRHWGCWRFWARGPGYPYDIPELGSYLVGREELGFGQCFTVQQRSRRHLDKQRVISIRFRYF